MKKVLLSCAIASAFLASSALASNTGLTVHNDSIAPITFILYEEGTSSSEAKVAFFSKPVRAQGTLNIDSTFLQAHPGYSVGLCWVDPKDKNGQTDCRQADIANGYPYKEVGCSNTLAFPPTKVYVYGGLNYIGHNDLEQRAPRYVYCSAE